MINTAPLLTCATYIALLLAIIGLWFGRRVWVAALSVAVVLGYAANVLYGTAIIWIAALGGVCLGYDYAKTHAPDRLRGVLMAFAAMGVCAFALLLGMHALPGFHNFLALDDVVLSSGAAPYTLYLNFDKTLVGIFILGFCYRAMLNRASDWQQALRLAAPIAAASIAVVALGAMVLGYLSWQPKWTSLFWLWAPVNLFFTCLSEEAFFRGFLQREMGSALRGMRHGQWLAVAVSAVLFGLAHFAGGPAYVALSTAAGLGYAIVYQRTRSIEMSILAHFTLNATHFLLFTYPQAL